MLKIVQPYAKLMPLPGTAIFTPATGRLLARHIEWCARISHRSEDAMKEGSYERFLHSVVLQHGDWSVVEHATVSVDMYVDRGITHELVRHRLFSYTQESTRFVNYKKKMPPSFIMPVDFFALEKAFWKIGIFTTELIYRLLIKLHISPQISRSVLPNALASRIIVTGNLRNWRHFFLMRTTKETHPQMRQVTIPLLEEFRDKIPVFFDDIVPMAKQSDNLGKGR